MGAYIFISDKAYSPERIQNEVYFLKNTGLPSLFAVLVFRNQKIRVHYNYARWEK